MSLAFKDPAGFEAMVMLLPVENRALRIAKDISDLCFELAEAKGQPGLHDPGLIKFMYDHGDSVGPNRLDGQFAILRAYCDESVPPLPGFDRREVRHTLRHYVRMFNDCGHILTPNITQWWSAGYPEGWTPPDQTITLASIGPHIEPIFNGSMLDLAHCIRIIQDGSELEGLQDKFLAEAIETRITFNGESETTLYEALRSVTVPRKGEIKNQAKVIASLKNLFRKE